MNINQDILEGLQAQTLTQADRLIMCMYPYASAPVSTSTLRTNAKEYGIKGVENWSISTVLSRARGKVVKLPAGWVLTAEGIRYAAQLIPRLPKVQDDVSKLRACSKNISNPSTKEYINEAITCLEFNCIRSSILMAWEGAIALLYEHVVKSCLNSFNDEATRRNNKWKPAKNSDDLANMKESEFLDIIAHLSVLSKSTKQQLAECLTLRNGCCHPNSLQIGIAKAHACLEILIMNVYERFG